MGMYDYIQCKIPLPLPEFQSTTFQTKDTPSQFLDYYEIREDGSLWHEVYDIEDRSDPKAQGLMRIVGAATRVNKRWKVVSDFNEKEIHFYTSLGRGHTGWVEFRAAFDSQTDKVTSVALVEHIPIDPEQEEVRRKEIAEILGDTEEKRES